MLFWSSATSDESPQVLPDVNSHVIGRLRPSTEYRIFISVFNGAHGISSEALTTTTHGHGECAGDASGARTELIDSCGGWDQSSLHYKISGIGGKGVRAKMLKCSLSSSVGSISGPVETAAQGSNNGILAQCVPVLLSGCFVWSWVHINKWWHLEAFFFFLRFALRSSMLFTTTAKPGKGPPWVTRNGGWKFSPGEKWPVTHF